eukprot:984549-Pyramimonas_sp.AAC.1
MEHHQARSHGGLPVLRGSPSTECAPLRGRVRRPGGFPAGAERRVPHPTWLVGTPAAGDAEDGMDHFPGSRVRGPQSGAPGG